MSQMSRNLIELIIQFRMQGVEDIVNGVADEDQDDELIEDIPEHIFDELSFESRDESRVIGRPCIPDKWSRVISM